MMHTHEVPISKFLNEFIEGSHYCCLDAATDAWANVLRSEKFQDFFTQLFVKSCEKHFKDNLEGILKFTEAFAPVALQLMISSLSIGTVAGVSTIYQAAHELEPIFEEKLNEYKPKIIAIMKSGPKGVV